MSEWAFIAVRQEGAVGVIELARPDVLNALSRQMVVEIVAAVELFDRDEAVRVIVLTGRGRAFAAGADIQEMAKDDPIRLERLNQFADWDRLSIVKTPMIAAVNGLALGGGFELALSCDWIVASATAEFGFPEVNLGVMPGAGGTQRLTKLIGPKRALEWLWTGARMSAKEAEQLGIVNRVVSPELLMEETMRLAERLAEQPPLALRLIKEAVQKAVDYPLDEGMQFERKNFYLLFASEDQKEGMAAFLEKRKPRFQGK
ncbi:enoyl-CoA hydratase [Geobacillus sp. 46C-IIa]|uniref:enoyl-CoA hydratase/isomerase family protein n=1 Tax=Geobacillus sp. 46C-IIa TaxID=1963025 RepID=UPI0009BCFE5E|nr:enoyl-CoA hydratase-related protein [Geobacillus sp. 46C-IIa]OQP04273.1 enoyl-CoA hydratase [Geobacillus sp. 46C-IIa]QNU29218.1 enoyl-CoA hydratase/isomerase family protein [Geobacillus sp. 46C-IIa]